MDPNRLTNRNSDVQSRFEMTTMEAGSLPEDGSNSSTDESRPTRRYQCLLLLSGFLMIFHVVGINSVFGIFQVGSQVPRRISH
jgi:hypothetical protein